MSIFKNCTIICVKRPVHGLGHFLFIFFFSFLTSLWVGPFSTWCLFPAQKSRSSLYENCLPDLTASMPSPFLTGKALQSDNVPTKIYPHSQPLGWPERAVWHSLNSRLRKIGYGYVQRGEVLYSGEKLQITVINQVFLNRKMTKWNIQDNIEILRYFSVFSWNDLSHPLAWINV